MNRRRRSLPLATALVVLAAGLAIPLVASTPARAADGDCGMTGAVTTFDGDGGALGAWNNATMWDTGAVPVLGQVCIPAGKTVTVATNVTLNGGFSSETLRVWGTLRIEGTNASASIYGDATIENTGTVEVTATGQFNVGPHAATFKNLPGGVVTVATGGAMNVSQAFENLGGVVDLSGGGTFSVGGGSATFLQGASSDVVPVQGTVTGGSVSITTGTLNATGTGAGAFSVPPGGIAYLAGTLAPDQSITTTCTNYSDTYLRVATSTTSINQGTITLGARVAGTTCASHLSMGDGAVLTNSGHILFGTPGNPTHLYLIDGSSTASVVNGATGTFTVNGTVSAIGPTVTTDGAFEVSPGAAFNAGNNSAFELRDGTITNHGAINLYHASTYAVGGIFRVMLGATVGNPISVYSYRVELLGPGAATFDVPPGGNAILQNPNGPIVIHPDQKFLVRNGTLGNVGPVENQGLIELTGPGDGYAYVGTSGAGDLTNHGLIRVTTSNAATGGYGSFNIPIVNAADGIVEALSGRGCYLPAGFTNSGLVDLQTRCFSYAGTFTLTPSSVLRVHSSATTLTGLDSISSFSNIDGTLDIVTDAGSPPVAGAPRDLIIGRPPPYNNQVLGSFANLTGSTFSPSLGYALVYTSTYPRKILLQTVSPVTDLVVSSMSAPTAANVGDDVTVAWNTSVGSTTSTTFTDSVFLSSSPNVDASAVLLGRVTRSGTVSGGVERAGSLQVRIPATSPGRRYLVVVADSGNALAVANRTAAVASVALQVGATALTVGAAAGNVVVGIDGSRVVGETTATLEGTRLLRLNGSIGQDVIVTISPATAVIALAASGRLPSAGDHDVAASGGTMIIPKGDGASERYILLRNTGATAVTVSVQATAPGLSITSTSPGVVLAGSPVETAILVKGTGFTGSSVVQLVCSAGTIDAASTQVDGPTQLIGLFALPTALGTCDVKVGAAVKPGGLTVAAPAVAVDTADLEVDVDVVSPQVVRSEVDNTITVRWTNRTAYSLPAPLIQVSVDVGTIRHPGGAATGTPATDILGIAPTGPAGILAPGASGSTQLLVSNVPAHTTVTYFTDAIDRAASFDFGIALSAGLGADVSAGATTWLETNGPALLGVPRNTTVAGLEQHLGDVATMLSSLGRRIVDPGSLLAFDLFRIAGNGRLDGFRSGEFGVGQEGLILPRLSVEAGSNDVLLSDGAQRLRYSHRANGTYVAPAGSADLLTAAVGGWSLVARDGTKRSFSADGALVSVTDPDLRVLTFGYTSGRLTSITDANGDVVTYGYDGGGRITSITDAVGRAQTFTYDGSGRMTSMTDAGLTASTTWTADNLVATMTEPNGVVVSLTRDSFGRVLTKSRNGVLMSSSAHNADGSITRTDAFGHTTTMWFDDTGSMAKLIDAADRVTVVRRDAAGNAVGTLADGSPIGDVLAVDQRGGATGSVDGAGGRTDVAWDVDGLLRSMTDPEGRATSFTRDAALRPTKVTDPAGASTTLSFDSFGRLAGTTDRTGRSTTLSYDAKDVMTQRSVAGYGAVTYSYDSHRNLTSATGPTGTTTFTHDGNDRLLSVTYPNGLGLTFTYDSVGRRTSVTTSDGQTTGATYDARGRLATVTVGVTTVTTYEYDAADRLSAIRSANGSRTVITRDSLGRITRQTTTCCTPDGATEGPTTVSDVQLTYDSRDRVLTRVEGGGTTTYGYDGAGRLASAVTTGAGARTITYTYDRAGNRLSVVDSLGGTATSTISTSGRLTSVGGQVVTHDAEGRQLSRGPNTYAWDGRGGFGSATVEGSTTTYAYDALGTPISRTTDGVTTKLLMDPAGLGWLVAEYSGAGAREAGYAWGQGIAARLDGAGAVNRYYATDPRGDVLALSDGAGVVTDTFRYLPFGEVAASTGSTVQPFGFGGNWGLRTEPTGLVNARARVYDPALGRFLSEDPVLFASSNPYTWASNDPVNRTDVTGGSDDPWPTIKADPVGYGAAALGINTDNGFDPLNSLQVGGLGLTGAGMLYESGTAALMARNAEGVKAWKNYAGWTADNAWKNAPNVKGWQKGHEMARNLAEEGKVMQANRGRVSQNMGRAGAALNFVQAGINVVNPPDEIKNGDWVDKSAFVVRQFGLAGVKTFVGRVPFADLLVDPAANALEGNALVFGWWWYGVDEYKLFNESHWNAKNELKKKKKGTGTGADAWDPNEILGPAGVTVGSDRFVARDDLLGYDIHFENMATASLPAGEVVVTHTLDTDLDLSTFALGTVTIGSSSFEAPPGQRAWSTLLDDRAQSGLYVRMKARLDLGTRTVTWTLTGIDPATMDRPADATLGFLPPNVTSPEGQGGMSYTVRALGTTATGAAIVAQASIVFDANPAILTNVDTVLIDAAAPTAAPTTPASSENPVVVTLGVTDDAGGSGAGPVDLWASKDGGAFDRIAVGIDGPTYDFTGEIGASYQFRVTPIDQVGNAGELSGASGAVQVLSPGGLPPVTAADAYLARIDIPLVVTVGAGLLANDDDPEDLPLTAVLVDEPVHGDVALAVDGSFTYTPDLGYTGPDSFTYRANDGTLDSAVTTVSITVRPHGIEVSDPVMVFEPTTTSGTVYAYFTVSLSKPYATKVTVKSATLNGTALSSKDYSRMYPTTVTFKAGETVKVVRVRIRTDDVVEPQEAFQLVLSKPSGAPIVDGTADALIGADPAMPVVSVSDAPPVAEPTTSTRVYAEFTVTLSKAWGKTVTVKLKTAPGTATKSKDYSSVSTTVTFRAGETVKVVRVRIYKDSLVEPEEQFTAVLSSPSRTVIGDGTAVGTINAS